MSDVPITPIIIADFSGYFDMDDNLKAFKSPIDITRGLTFGFEKTQRIGTFKILAGNIRREATYNWVAHWFYMNLYPYVLNPTHNGRALRLTVAETRSVGSEYVSQSYEQAMGRSVSNESFQLTIYGRRYSQIICDLFQVAQSV